MPVERCFRHVGTHISRHHGTTIRCIAEGTTALARRARIDTPRCNWATAACAADRAEGTAAGLVGAGCLTSIADAAAAVGDRVGVDETCRKGGAGKEEQDGQEEPVS